MSSGLAAMFGGGAGIARDNPYGDAAIEEVAAPAQPQQQAAQTGLAFGAGARSPNDVAGTTKRSIVAEPTAQPGQLLFGDALADVIPDKKRQGALSFAASLAEQQGMALALAPRGQERLKELKAAGQLYEPQAQNYATLFVDNRVDMPEATAAKSQKLQRLEESVMRQQVLAPQMQVAPVEARMEIARIRAELDRETLPLQRSKGQAQIAINKANMVKADRLVAELAIAERLDTKTDAELQRALLLNEARKLHPSATNAVIGSILEQRRKSKTGVGPDATPADPAQVKEAVSTRLGAQTMEQLQAFAEFTGKAGPMALRQSNLAETAKQQGITDPTQLLQLAEQDDRHNQMRMNLAAATGGLPVGQQEILDALVRRQKTYQEAGLTPAMQAQREAEIDFLTNTQTAIFEEKIGTLTRLGVQVDPQEMVMLQRQMRNAQQLVRRATTPQARAEAERLAAQVQSDAVKRMDARVEELSADPIIRAALKNTLATGQVGSASEGAALLANTTARGQTGYEARSYLFKVTDSAGVSQTRAVPLSSAAGAAEAKLNERIQQVLISRDSDGFAAQMRGGKGKNAPAPKEFPGELDDKEIRSVYQAIGPEAKTPARAVYRDALQQSTLIMLLNKHIGDDIASRQIQDSLIDTGSSGSAFKSELLQTDPKTGAKALNIVWLADALRKAGKGETLGKMIADLEIQDTRDELASVLEPKTMREKSLFAFLYGNDSYVRLGSGNTPIATGPQNPYSYIQGQVFDKMKNVLQQSVADTRVRDELASRENERSYAEATAFGAGSSFPAQEPASAQTGQSFGSIVEEARRARAAMLGSKQP